MIKSMYSFGIRYPGFNTLKVRDRGGMPVAFADFEVPHAANYNCCPHFPV